MRLYLAVAVLMLAFVAYTEAQDETMEQKLAKFTEQMTEMSRGFTDKAKDIASTATNWIQTHYERIKASIGEIAQ